MISIVVAMGVMLFVVIACMTISFGRNPRNVGRPPSDSNDLNIGSFLNEVSLFVIEISLTKDDLDNFIIDDPLIKLSFT